MPQTSFEDLPAELLDSIASTLDLADLCNLRSSTATIAAKTSGVNFKSFFRQKTVIVTSRLQLDEFIFMTSQSPFGCLVEELTLRGVLSAEDGAGNLKRPSGVVTSLTNALSNICNNSDTRRLACLRLEATRVYPPITISESNFKEELRNAPNRWRDRWLAAELTFATVCAALATSGLQIDKLDVFGTTNQCSLACDGLRPVLAASNLSTSLGGLKVLSLSLSNHLHYRGDEDGGDCGEQMCRLLGLCPALESLELHWYSTMPCRPGTRPVDYLFFDCVAEAVRLPCLRSLSLRGLFVSESALLTFLSRTAGLTSLILEEMRLLTGRFVSVFDATVAGLVHLQVDSLYETEGMLQFFGSEEPHFPTSDDGRKGPLHLTRIGADAQCSVEYDLIRGRALSSPALFKRFKWRARHYGPPPVQTLWARNPNERQLKLQDMQEQLHHKRLIAEQYQRQREIEQHWRIQNPLHAVLGARTRPELLSLQPAVWETEANAQDRQPLQRLLPDEVQQRWVQQQHSTVAQQDHHYEMTLLHQQQLRLQQRRQRDRERQDELVRFLIAGGANTGGYISPRNLVVTVAQPEQAAMLSQAGASMLNRRHGSLLHNRLRNADQGRLQQGERQGAAQERGQDRQVDALRGGADPMWGPYNGR